MEAQNQKTHNLSIDVLRIVSILAVVLIHTTTRTFEFTKNHLLETQSTLFLNQASRFAVPLFFMISGFVLELSYPFHSNPFSYLYKRISRIFFPYIFWSLLYILFIYPQPVTNLISTLPTGSASYQLYFLPSLMVFYLLFPLVSRFYNFLSKKNTLIVLAIIQVCLLSADYYFHSIKIFNPIAIAMFNFFPFIFGAVMSHHQQSLYSFLNKYKYYLAALVVFLVVFVFWEGGSRYIQTGNYLSFYSQWRPSILAYTFCLAGLLYYLFNRVDIPVEPIKLLSKLSFFVFFIHIAILEISWRYLFVYVFPSSLQNLVWFDAVFFLYVAATSFLIAYICHRLPHLSKITG